MNLQKDLIFQLICDIIFKSYKYKPNLCVPQKKQKRNNISGCSADGSAPALGFEHDRRRGRMKGVRKGVAVDRWQDGLPSKTDVGNRKQGGQSRSAVKTREYNKISGCSADGSAPALGDRPDSFRTFF